MRWALYLSIDFTLINERSIERKWIRVCVCECVCVCALTLRSQVNFTLYGLCLTVKVRLFRSIFPRLLANSNKEWIMGLWLILCMHNALHNAQAHSIQFRHPNQCDHNNACGWRTNAHGLSILSNVPYWKNMSKMRFQLVLFATEFNHKHKLMTLLLFHLFRFFYFLHGMFDRSIDKYLSATKFRNRFFSKAITI